MRMKQSSWGVGIRRGLITRGSHTSCCRTTLQNLGQSPRVVWGRGGTAPDLCISERKRVRDFDSSHVRIMTLLSMAIPPENRPSLCEHFSLCVKDNVMMVKTAEWRNYLRCDIHHTDISWIAEAYGCPQPQPLHSPEDMFPASAIQSGMQLGFMNEFHIMDVILNRCFSPEDVCNVTEVDPDEVAMVRAYKAEDILDGKDYKYHAKILFLPQAGIFYCSREQCRANVGVEKSLIDIDMSWLRLSSHGFGVGSYVKRFFYMDKMQKDAISALNVVSTDKIPLAYQNRVTSVVNQVFDAEGLMPPPDVYQGEREIGWSKDELVLQYNHHLAYSNTGRKDERHYAAECLHHVIPDDCWIVGPSVMHNVNIIVKVVPLGKCTNRQSIIMVRNAIVPGVHSLEGAVNNVVLYNRLLRQSSPRGAVRANKGDVGFMYAVGTHTEHDGVTETPYKSNSRVPDVQLWNMVSSLAVVGCEYFPQVML